MKVVIRIGGSVIASPPDAKLINQYAKIVNNLKQQGHELVVIVGGGITARDFIRLASNIGLIEKEQDEIAISVSRLFAQLLAIKIGGLDWKNIPTSLRTVVNLLKKRRIVVMGGLRPGMTTDTVAALVASKIGADLIVKYSDQDGVYTRDPRRYPDAKKLDVIGFEDLDTIFEQNIHRAGIHQIIDPEAVRILKRRRIKTVVTNGLQPSNILNILKGERTGTIIQ